MTTNHEWPDGPAPGDIYLCFTDDESEEHAAARFKERFGEMPEHIFDHKGLLRLGPVREKGDA